MSYLVTTCVLVAAVALAAPVGLFCLEVLLSLWPWRSRELTTSGSPRTVVLIPAHNEETVLSGTLQTLLPTLGLRDSVLVVADNCCDGTADVARTYGVQVIERTSATERGKGFALDFGLKHLAADPPDVIVFVDADCRVASELVSLLAQAAFASGRPVQGLNLCDPDPAGGPLQVVSALAFRFKNLVRPIGLIRLGSNCHLSGTGMALPWTLVQATRLASGNVVEDMQLGIDLALAGKPPLFVPEACINSPLPQPPSAARTQRTRWEHGHLSTILSQCPRLALLAARKGRWDFLLLALDLAIPPLSLLVLMLMSVSVASLATGLIFGNWLAGCVALTLAFALAAAVLAGWFVHCRDRISLLSLLVAPLYAVSKLPIYLAFLTRRQTAWVRTERTPASDKEASDAKVSRAAAPLMPRSMP